MSYDAKGCFLSRGPMATEQTLLVVDDDRNVLPALTALLEVHSSYHVLSASGFVAAVNLLEGGRVDLLVVDAVLPKPHSGKEIAHVARAVRPDTAIVLTTADWKPDLGAFPDGTVFLPKPFGVKQLLAAIAVAVANVRR